MAKAIQQMSKSRNKEAKQDKDKWENLCDSGRRYTNSVQSVRGVTTGAVGGGAQEINAVNSQSGRHSERHGSAYPACSQRSERKTKSDEEVWS